MPLRAQAARWFELLVPRASLARAVDALGATGEVQFDPDGEEGVPLDLSAISERLNSFRKLAESYKDVWPAPHYRTIRHDVMLERTLDDSLQRLEQWAETARPLLRGIERMRGLRDDLCKLRDFAAAVPAESDLDLGQLVDLDPSMRGVLFLLPPDAAVPSYAKPVIYYRLPAEDRLYLLVLGEREAVEELEQELAARKARPLALPEWIEGTPAHARKLLDDHIADLDRRLAEHESKLEILNQRHRVAEALGAVRRLEWMVEHLSGLPVSDNLAWVTGWTSDHSGERLRRALDAAGIPAVIRFPVPPEDKIAPTILHNPPWAKPFEVFVKLLGTPSGSETDPSGLVAIVAPLLFGYMFGDVGQGAVLLVAGLVLHRRVPALRMLIPGGALAIVFGFLFGSVFCREDLIPALWTHPISHPLDVLLPPLGIGAALIALSQAMSGVTAWWSGTLSSWLAKDLGLLVLYLGGAVGAVFEPALIAILVGALWYIAGHAWAERERLLLAVAAGVGELAEQLLRLIVNTLSFVRVGAFALAHAGLALAVVSLAEAAGTAAGLVILVVGNLGILALEGLVVSVQTTRLILFEFFIRFVRAEGRPFEPSTPPASSAPA